MIESGADFSECKRYRYRLWRRWNRNEPYCNFIMLNPSTADQNVNDPTVERCQRRAAMWGYGGLLVTNLFAYRSTNPKLLKLVADPIGPENDRIIVEVARKCKLVICAWGSHLMVHDREGHVVRILRDAGIKPQVLGHNRPAHPLYLSYDRWPQLWSIEGL